MFSSPATMAGLRSPSSRDRLLPHSTLGPGPLGPQRWRLTLCLALCLLGALIGVSVLSYGRGRAAVQASATQVRSLRRQQQSNAQYCTSYRPACMVRHRLGDSHFREPKAQERFDVFLWYDPWVSYSDTTAASASPCLSAPNSAVSRSLLRVYCYDVSVYVSWVSKLRAKPSQSPLFRLALTHTCFVPTLQAPLRLLHCRLRRSLLPGPQATHRDTSSSRTSSSGSSGRRRIGFRGGGGR